MFDTYRIMTPAQAQEYVEAVSKLEWEQGKARTKEATGTVKKNEEIKISTSPQAEALIQSVVGKMKEHKNIFIDHMVKKMMSPKFNRYLNSGEYQRHGDAAVMGGKVRTDLSCTVFLSHPDTYKGGDLCIEGSDGGHHSIKGDPGTCVVYPCRMPHWVTPVTEGERICLITWFESCYRNPQQRELQRRFLRYLHDMEKEADLRYGHYHTAFGSIQSELQRMWLDYE